MSKKNLKSKNIVELEKEKLFKMVYQWGRFGLVVDHTAPAFNDQLLKLYDEVLKSFKN